MSFSLKGCVVFVATCKKELRTDTNICIDIHLYIHIFHFAQHQTKDLKKMSSETFSVAVQSDDSTDLQPPPPRPLTASPWAFETVKGAGCRI